MYIIIFYYRRARPYLQAYERALTPPILPHDHDTIHNRQYRAKASVNIGVISFQQGNRCDAGSEVAYA